MTNTPQVNKVIADIKKGSEENGLKIKTISVDRVNLKGQNKGEKLENFVIEIKSEGDFNQIKSFVDTIFNKYLSL